MEKYNTKYFNKYLKYKFKYNELKNQIGGITIQEEIDNIDEKLYIKNILTVNLQKRVLGETSNLDLNLQSIKDLEDDLIQLKDTLKKKQVKNKHSDNEGKYVEITEKRGRFTIIKRIIKLKDEKKNKVGSDEDIYSEIDSWESDDKTVLELEDEIENLEYIIKYKKKEWDDNNKSFNLIENFLERNPKSYLNWYLWAIINTDSPSEFNKSDPKYNINYNLYDDDNYKLFTIEKFINGFPVEGEKNINFLEELENKYDESFNEWDDKPNFNLDYNLPVYVQKVKIKKDDAKICIIGDIHSSLHSLLSILFKIKKDYFQNEEKMILKPNRYIIFLGDIIDRGPYSVELLMLILCLKNYNFDNVFIINGNHEDYPIFSRDGTEEEFFKQHEDIYFKEDLDKSIINKILNRLPSCIYLEFGGKRYHLSHGAFDPIYAGLMDNLDDLFINTNNLKKSKLNLFLESNEEFDLVSINDIHNNYKWGDLSNNPYIMMSPRGRDIFQFGHQEIKLYLEKFNISNIISGHQDNEPINFILYPKQIENLKNKISPIYPLDLKVSEIYNKHHGNLYQPDLSQFKSDNIKFDLFDNSYMALVTSTATVSRNMGYQGVYLELHKKLYSKKGFEAGILSKRCGQCGRSNSLKEWNENGCDICLNNKIMKRTNMKKVKKLKNKKDLIK